MDEALPGTLALGVVVVQALAFTLLGGSVLMGRSLSEVATGRLMRGTYCLAFVLALASCFAFVASGQDQVVLNLGELKLQDRYEFHAVLLLDSLSIPFLLLATLLCGVVAIFSEKYLHRENGFHRFFLLLCLFGFGDTLTILAGSIETLYAAWETLGLTSALLIGFFHERPGPVQNGLYAFVVYRFSDLSLALATVTIYHLTRTGDFTSFLGHASWPNHQTTLSPHAASVVGFFILLAAMGKAGQLPSSGWLRRAMEGPTPSTAIFYGALSVHAGAFLLLRCSSLLDASPSLSAATVCIGLLTAFWSRAVAVTQTDVKCGLAFASLTQVGLIFAEIGLGLRIFPVVHIVAHALIRSIQFLRAPSLLHEMHELHSAVGGRPVHKSAYRGWMSNPKNYRMAADLFFLEIIIERFIASPFLAFCRFLQKLDSNTLDFLVGPDPKEGDPRV